MAATRAAGAHLGGELGVTVGFVMLVHDPLDRAAQVARHLAEAGAPIVIHVDARVPAPAFAAFAAALGDLPRIRFARRQRCRWGTWSIVAATLEASGQMLRDFPEVGHVFLACGTALPIRPLADLRAFLARRPETDFIESVTTEDVAWTIGGLDRERFTLSFPSPGRGSAASSISGSPSSGGWASAGGSPQASRRTWARNGGA
jgi:hypothetical protein